MNKKTVIMPIRVPDSIYCVVWTGEDTGCCEHFSNENGYAECELKFRNISVDSKGYVKPEACQKLMLFDPEAIVKLRLARRDG